MRLFYSIIFSLIFVSGCGQDSSSLVSKSSGHSAEEPFRIGVGIGDITGPAMGMVMLGYVKLGQDTKGIHTRLRSRAFVIEETSAASRALIVVVDLCFVTTAVRQQVLALLEARYGDTYGEHNVLITANHTHSGPAGFSHHDYFNMPVRKFSPANFQAIVGGIVDAIDMAHESKTPGRIKIAKGMVEGIARNRSPIAYEANPLSEREAYASDVDEGMTLLRFEDAEGSALGMLNWHALHATSVDSRNQLIHSDNKGLAAMFIEKTYGADYFADRSFVAAFANSNAGDVSPNIAGNIDNDAEWDCPEVDNDRCVSWSARAQAEVASQLFEQGQRELSGRVRSYTRYLDLGDVAVRDEFSAAGEQQTCPAAIGLSKLAGAEDGRGPGREGISCSNPTLAARLLCRNPLYRCHGEKPVTLGPGYANPPGSAQIIPLQLLTIGDLAIAAVPAEFTTMAGRRLRATLRESFRNIPVEEVVLAAYSNAYTGYVTTREEYQLQQYEGASNHFGEWTLAAYQQEMAGLAGEMDRDELSDNGLRPLDRSGESEIIDLASDEDLVPEDSELGNIVRSAEDSYRAGDLVEVVFWGANPSNAAAPEGSFIEIQRQVNDEWRSVAWDGDFSTKLSFARGRAKMTQAKIIWDSRDAVGGNYRILYRGRAHRLNQDPVDFRAVSNTFAVVR